MNAPFKPDAPPEWNLADLYVGRDDPRIETDELSALLQDAWRVVAPKSLVKRFDAGA